MKVGRHAKDDRAGLWKQGGFSRKPQNGTKGKPISLTSMAADVWASGLAAALTGTGGGKG
jgi:hypothetical protein